MTRLLLSSYMEQKKRELQEAGFQNADLDVNFLTQSILGLSPTDLFFDKMRFINSPETARLDKAFKRRLLHESTARILGEREFWSLPFGLNAATLEPRPDTETLIRGALKYFDEPNRCFSVADLGTGSGCILLSLLHERKKASGLGIDLEPLAIDQARSNAIRVGVQERARFKVNSWLEGIAERFDLIIANPPYISSIEIATLMPEVQKFDPVLALDGGTDGYDAYRMICQDVKVNLLPGGYAILEIGQGQAAKVITLLEEGGLRLIEVFKDYNGIERCIIAQVNQN